MNGTSASAPQVTGLVALMLQYNHDVGNPQLPAADIRANVIAGAEAAQKLPPPPPRILQYNRHQDADETRLIKQQDVWDDLIGAGKVNVVETLKHSRRDGNDAEHFVRPVRATTWRHARWSSSTPESVGS